MDLLKEKRNAEEQKWKEWMKSLVTDALEKDEVEDFMYEYRWEFVDEERCRMRCRLYPLWAAIRSECSKEDMEALYQKGYRYLHKPSSVGFVLELRDFNMKCEDLITEESMLVENITIAVQAGITGKCPPILLEEYEQLESYIKDKAISELRGKILLEFSGRYFQEKKEEFLAKMKEVFPKIYEDCRKDWIE